MKFFRTERHALWFFLCLAVGMEWFIDDASRVANRQQIRYNSAQIEDMYIAYNHLLKPINWAKKKPPKGLPLTRSKRLCQGLTECPSHPFRMGFQSATRVELNSPPNLRSVWFVKAVRFFHHIRATKNTLSNRPCVGQDWVESYSSTFSSKSNFSAGCGMSSVANPPLLIGVFKRMSASAKYAPTFLSWIAFLKSNCLCSLVHPSNHSLNVSSLIPAIITD